ncbi:MAG: Ig-like domain-containing protein [Betaproteobacteria bacterium]
MPRLAFRLPAFLAAIAVTLTLAACGGGDASPPAPTTAPTLNIDGGAGTALANVTFTFTFSEDVGATFTADDVAVSNGSKGAFTKVSAIQYTLVVSPAPDSTGSVGVSVAAGSYANLVGNAGVAASASKVFDTRVPTVAITSSAAGTTASGNITFTFTFNKDVGGTFTSSDVTVTGATAGIFTASGGTTATLVVSPAANSAGTATVSVAAGSFADGSGRTNTAPASLQQNYDTTVPVPTTTIVSFQEATAPTLAGFGGAEDSTVVTDPTDAANKVGKVVKSAGAELWAGTTVSICANSAIVTLPFSATLKTLSVRVWSPDAGIPVRLKVENAADGTKSVETEATTTAAGAWQTLTFNFANQAAGTAALDLGTTYNKASIFFNFGKTGAEAGGAKTYYFDDLKFIGSSFTVQCPTPPAPSTISFDETPPPVLTGFGGAEDAIITADPSDATNKVARIIKSAGAELWAGTTISNSANLSIAPIAFGTSTVITARVWSPDVGIPVRLKVEDASDGTKSVETEATTTVANGWETLSFNFANQAAGTAALNLGYTYNKMSVFFNFGKTGAQAGGAKTYLIDAIRYSVAASGGSWPAVSFDAPGVTYTLTGFGGAEDSSVAVDPAGGTNMVGKVVKSSTAELWAGTTVSTGANLSLPRIPFTASATSMTMRVRAPAAGIPVRLKVEDAADPSKSVETEALTTTANAWHTLTFNFANPAAGTAALNLGTSYTKASVFFNFGKTGAAGGAGTYYFDDLSLAP